MIIAGEGKNPAFEHIRLVGEEFQIREKDVIEITEKVMEALENWKEFAREAGIRFRSYSGLVHFGKKTSKGPSLTKYAAQVPWFLHTVWCPKYPRDVLVNGADNRLRRLYGRCVLRPGARC